MRILSLVLFCVLSVLFLTGCADIDAKAQAEIESKIDKLVEARFKAVGVDMRQKIADDLKAEFHTQLNTQNTGTFSGGAIYVLAFGVFIVICVVFVVLWLVNAYLKYKKTWHLISESIEHHSNKDNSTVKDVKRSFDLLLNKKGLKSFVLKNLEKRGLNKNFNG